MPRLWPGETAVIFASGPSLTVADVEYCRGRARAIAVNRTLTLSPWADAFHAADARCYRWLQVEVAAFQGLKFTMEREAGDLETGQILLKNGGIWGLSTDPETIRNGRNSGYQAVNIAVLMGCTRIVLLGFDLQAGSGGKVHHWHPDHPDNFNPSQMVYGSWRGAFRSMVKPLADLGVSVVNCSRATALDCFPRAALEATL